MPALGKQGAAGEADAASLMRRLADDQGVGELDEQRQSLRSGGSSFERADKVKAVRSALGSMTTKGSDFDKRDKAFSRLAAELGVAEAPDQT